MKTKCCPNQKKKNLWANSYRQTANIICFVNNSASFKHLVCSHNAFTQAAACVIAILFISKGNLFDVPLVISSFVARSVTPSREKLLLVCIATEQWECKHNCFSYPLESIFFARSLRNSEVFSWGKCLSHPFSWTTTMKYNRKLVISH